MVKKHDLVDWVVEALKSLGGSGTIVGVCKYIWSKHESKLKESGNIFYTWQYDVRWAAQELRNRGVCKSAKECKRGMWTLR